MLLPFVMASLDFTFTPPSELGLGGSGMLLYEKIS
jgi:hypothetical protein